MNSIIEENINR